MILFHEVGMHFGLLSDTVAGFRTVLNSRF